MKHIFMALLVLLFACCAYAASLDVAIKVLPASGRGPQPLPSPYPQQPGFTLISDLSQITGPGRWQLTQDVPAGSPPPPNGPLSNTVIDAGGHKMAFTIGLSGSNVSLINWNLVPSGSITVRPSLFISGNGITIANSSIGPVWIQGGQNVTLINNLIEGDKSKTDDVVLVYSTGDNVPIQFQAINNIIKNAYDAGIEGVGAWYGGLIQNNQFANCPIAVGGWYDVYRGSNFHLKNFTFQNNVAEKTSVAHLFDFGFYAEDDATANANMGPIGPPVWQNVQPNSFTGDGWY